jgi:hypothetical protein
VDCIQPCQIFCRWGSASLIHDVGECARSKCVIGGDSGGCIVIQFSVFVVEEIEYAVNRRIGLNFAHAGELVEVDVAVNPVLPLITPGDLRYAVVVCCCRKTQGFPIFLLAQHLGLSLRRRENGFRGGRWSRANGQNRRRDEVQKDRAIAQVESALIERRKNNWWRICA